MQHISTNFKIHRWEQNCKMNFNPNYPVNKGVPSLTLNVSQNKINTTANTTNSAFFQSAFKSLFFSSSE